MICKQCDLPYYAAIGSRDLCRNCDNSALRLAAPDETTFSIREIDALCTELIMNVVFLGDWNFRAKRYISERTMRARRETYVKL